MLANILQFPFHSCQESSHSSLIGVMEMISSWTPPLFSRPQISLFTFAKRFLSILLIKVCCSSHNPIFGEEYGLILVLGVLHACEELLEVLLYLGSLPSKVGCHLFIEVTDVLDKDLTHKTCFLLFSLGEVSG